MGNVSKDYILELKRCSNFIEQVNFLNNISEKFKRKDPIKSLELSKEAYKISLRNGYKDGMAISLYIMGRNYWLIGQLQKSVCYSMKSIDISVEVKNEKIEADALNILGNVNYCFENYDNALEKYIRALKLARNNKLKKLEACILNNIGEIHRELEDYHTALNYYNESKMIYKEINEEFLCTVPLLNLGHTYYTLDKFSLSKKLISTSLKIARKYNDKIQEMHSLYHMGILYFKLKKFYESLGYLKEALNFSIKLKSSLTEINILIDLHELMMVLDKNCYYYQYLINALCIAEEVEANNLIAKVCSKLATLYENQKQYEKALYYYKKYHDTERKASNYTVEEKLKSITAQFKIEKYNKEKEIYRLINIDLKGKTKELEKKTKELEEAYNNIKIISDIGQSLTATLNLEKILNKVYENINELMDAAVFAIGILDKDSKNIDYSIFCIEGNKTKKFPPISMDNKFSLAVWCTKNKKEILISEVKDRNKDYIDYIKNMFGFNIGSVIYCPLMIKDSVLGVMTVQSRKNNAYNQYDFNMLKALASYISIAIKNAMESEKLEKEIQTRKNIQNNLVKVNEKLLKLSEMDGLTGICNRRYFDKYLQNQWEKAKKNAKYISLIMIDIDCFKEYNDNYGHLEGDEIIKNVANTLKNMLEKSNYFLVRYGGDEFIAVLYDANLQIALQMAKQLRKKVLDLNIEHKYSKIKHILTLSMGVATVIPNDNIQLASLICKADNALYSAKSKGRNRVEFIRA